MDVSIIIVNYNSFKFIKNAVNSIFEKTIDIDYEIIIVDNASPDNSGPLIKDYFHEKIYFIQSVSNLGFGGGNNLGLKYANGRNIFLLNPDTILINNAVKILSDFLDSNPTIGICGGNLYDANHDPAHSFGSSLPGLISEVSRIKNSVSNEFNNTHNDIEVGYITGADMMIRHSIFDETYAFDEDFFMYYEETELTYRVHQLGYKVFSVPKARIMHLESVSLDNWEKKLKLVLKGRRLYYHKTTNRFVFFIYQVILSLIVSIKICYFTLRSNSAKVSLWKKVFQYS